MRKALLITLIILLWLQCHIVLYKKPEQLYTIPSDILADTSMPVFLEPKPKYEVSTDGKNYVHWDGDSLDPNLSDFDPEKAIENPSETEFYKD